jgi:PAS domain S-box-containing protein
MSEDIMRVLAMMRDELEAPYQRLAETARDVIFTLSPEGVITSLNPAFESIIGWSRPEWVGKPFVRLIHPDDVSIATKLFQSALQTKTLPLFELRIVSKSGKHIVGEFAVTAQIQGGKVIGLFGIARDITARRRASETRLENLLDLVPDAIIMIDDNQRIIVFNHGAEQIFGYRAEELLGQPLDLLLSSRVAERHREHIRIFAAGSEQARRMGERPEIFGRRKDGTEFPSEASIAKLSQNDQTILTVILRDITRRKQAAQALQEQAKILDQIHDSVVSTDLEGHVTSWNKGAERLFGYSVEEAVGRHISFLYSEDHYEFLQQEVIKPLKAKGNHEVEVQMVNRSGEAFYAHLSLSLLRDSAGVATGMIGYSMDISEQKQAEVELSARARQQAVVANLGQRALADTDLTLFMDEAVRQVARTLEVEYCQVLELLPEGEALLLRAGVGWQKGYVGQATVSTAANSQAGYTLLAGAPVIVDDLRTETRFSGPPLLIEHNVVSGISTIIQGKGQPFGILGAHTTKRQAFTEDDIHFLQGVTNVLAMAIGRKQAEEALRENEERFRQLAENIQEVFWLCNPDITEIFYISPAYEQIWGHTCQSLYEAPQSFLEAIHPEERQQVMSAVLAQIQTGFDLEFRIVRPDGSIRWVRDRAFPIQDGSGQVYRIAGIAEDITERKWAAEAMKQQADLLEQTHDAIMIWEFGGNIRYWNKGAEDLYGWSREEAEGCVTHELLQTSHPISIEELENTLRQMGRWEGEVEHTTRDGRQIIVDTRHALVSYGPGAGYVLETNHNVTARKQAEKALRARTHQQAAVADLGQRALAGTDPATLINEAVHRVAQTLEVEYCQVLELLPEGEALLLRAGVGWQEGLVGQALVETTSHSEAGYTLLSDEPVIVEDLRTERRFKGSPLLIEHNVVSGISTIIQGKGQPFGTLAAHTTKRRTFNQDDVHFLQAVANVLALAIERKGAEQALESYVLRLEVLHKIDQAILAAQSPAEIANAALEYLQQQLALYERASVSLFDFEANETIQLAVNVNNDTRLGAGKHVPLDDSVDLVSLEQGLPHMVVDIEAMDHLSATDEQLLAEGLRSYINVPLISQGQLIGVLNLGAKAPGAFGAEQVEIVRQVADSLAIAIQQARLFERLSLAHTRLQSLSRRLVEVEEMERRRIAQDLHDEIGQTLTAVQINLQGLQRRTDRTEYGVQLEENIDLVKQTLQQVRQFSLDLRPSSLDDLGLIATLRWYVDRQAQRGGFAAQFRAEPLEMELPPELEITCFRVIQEALTNVLRHAQAQQVRVELQQHEAELGLTIQDDGVGFDVKAALNRTAHGASLGLLGMQERVRLAGGQFDLQARSGQGTTIRVRFPLVASSEAYRADFQ